MADLVETSVWAGIRQIETTDPVVGGPPNLATGAGMSNIPHLMLANRTRFLRDQMDGAGIGLASMAAINNLDTLTKNGHFNFTSGATGAPITGTGSVIHATGAASSEATQVVRMFGSSRSFWRRRAGGTWLPWAEIWAGSATISNLATIGYQSLPSGLLMQWGTLPNVTHGSAVTFPIAFPTACLGIVYGDQGGTAGNAQIIGASGITTTGFTASVVRHDGDTGTSSTYTYLALGN